MWQLQTRSLSESFRVIVPDMPGHGALAHVRFRLADAVKRIADLVDREAGGRAILTGMSLGGYVAMEFAARHPEKLTGLVLISCTAEPTGLGAALYWGGTWFTSVMPIPWLSAMKRFLGRFFFSEEHAHLVVGNHFRGGAQGIRAIMFKSSVEKVRRFPGPTLFINGQRDYPFRSSERRFFAAARQARLELIPRAYHVCNLDDPPRVNALIRQFAETVSARAGGA
jgi:pimeloyl-ACP methyl ester carboxylesterase